MIKILIADDHQVVRNGLKHVLQDEFKDIELGEAGDYVEIFKNLKENKWNILLLDINMPGRNGLDVLQQMKYEGNKTPVLVMSMHSEEQVALRVLKLGASGYLSKEASQPEIIKAVRHILEGRKYVSPSLAQILAEQLENPVGKQPHELLSDREFQTFLLIGKGISVSKIAEKLSLSVPTISTYRARILEKLGMKCTSEIIVYAVENKLV